MSDASVIGRVVSWAHDDRTRPPRVRFAHESSRLACVAGMVVMVVLGVVGPGRAEAQDATRQTLARELAELLIDDQMRRGLEQQVSLSVARVLAGMLQERLNRRLQEPEIKALVDIVQSFVAQTLTPGLVEQIGARAYASHFDESELRELLQFQRSAVGRKAARLTPIIGIETAQAIEGEIERSPALPQLMVELQRVFPVLRSSESP